MNIAEYHSALDTERFGFKIAKVNSFDFKVNDIVSELKLNGYRLILSKVNSSNIHLINELEKNGFELKDIQLTYSYDLSDPIPLTLAEGVTIRTAEPSDQEALYNISIKSFNNYGHYSADLKLDQNKCREIYGDWIVRSFDKKVADNIFVAVVNNQPVGFLSHKIYANEHRYAVGGIGAVDQEFRSKDIFKSIIVSGINWAILNNCKWVEHNILVTNYAVNRSFSRLGFKASNSYITFHKWL